MQALPRRFRVSTDDSAESLVTLASAGPDGIASAASAEFGGSGDQWSPETLLIAAVADCFVLSFRAKAEKICLISNSLNPQLRLECQIVAGVG